AASAAFDGEANADERALVEASDAFRDEMSIYGTLRDDLRDVVVPAAARESAISAALAAFDLDRVPPAEITPSSATAAPVVSLAARRQRQYGWLGAAAAAVVAVLVVGVIARSGGEDQKTSLQAPSAQGTIPSDSAAKSAPAIEIAPVAGGAAADTAAETAATTAASTAETTAESTADTTSGTLFSAETAATDSLSDRFATAPRLDTEDQLVAFASGLTTPITPAPVALTADSDTATAASTAATADTSAGSTATTAAAAPSGNDATGCTAVGLEPAGPAVYQGRPVYVVRDGAGGRIIVIDAETCTITTVIPFPTP
ncbi:MAG: hypothetical protein JWL72_3798, partial [Ilumatobacteraceae bacterium]|nr:hypothetical protein [Ilumatobacteraceae bacterium]